MYCRTAKLRILCRSSVWESNFNDIITALGRTDSVIIFINAVSNTLCLTTTINSTKMILLK